jgi:Flp pilus assembly protein TadD
MISAKRRNALVVTALIISSFAASPRSSESGTMAARAADEASTLVRNNNLGVAYMEQLKFDQAAMQFAKNSELRDSFVPGYVNLGIAHFYRQDYESALTSLTKAIQLDKDQIQAHFMLGLIYRNQDQPEEAIQSFSQVFRHDPDDATTNYFLGLLHSRQKNYEAAIERLRSAIARQPYNASARYNLAIALLRSGKREEGQQEMTAFRDLQGQFGTDTVGLQYREQGKYSFVIDDLSEYLPEVQAPEEHNPVVFQEISADAGLQFLQRGLGRLEVRAGSQSIAPYLGSGLSFGDYDGDGWIDLFVGNAAAGGVRSALFRNRGEGTFEEKTEAAGIRFAGHNMVPLWGDVDNDEDLDLYLVNRGKNVLYRNEGNGHFLDITDQAGVGDSSWGVTGTFVDVDHDGDLDILIGNLAEANYEGEGFPQDLQGARNVLYRNNGDGSFADITETAKLADIAPTLALMATDFNNSRDIDLFVANIRGSGHLLSNMRNGSFKDLADHSGLHQSGIAGLAVGDFNQDGLMDFVVGGLNAGETKLLLNQPNGAFVESSLGDRLEASAMGSVVNAEPLDFDNDGDLDLLMLGFPLLDRSGPSSATLVLLENRRGQFEDVSRQAGLSEIAKQPLRGLSVADFDNDGDLDFAVNVNGGSPLLFRNDGGNRNNWIQMQLVGSSSNRQGIGTKVEVLTGRHWQKMEVAAGHGFLSQSPSIVHFGLGKIENVDMVRMLWPGGVLQSEIDRPVNSRLVMAELDRKGTSCPIMYVWNGEHYSFQTDFLGGSAFGNLLSPGTFNYPDSDEYIRLDRDRMSLKDGHVAITLNNQLEEVIFFDKLELLAIDHPADYELYPDEKLLPGPPYQAFRLLPFQAARPPLSATDGQGLNVLVELSQIDRVYPAIFQHLPFKGYASLHELILDLGDVDPAQAVLVMHAWIDYADSTSNLAASQAGVALIPPYLQVQDGQGNWITVIERMGFPAGLPKAMTVDLSGKFLSASRKVKIVTNMRIHWDQILVGNSPVRDDYRLHRLAASVADLHFKGFPAWVSPDGRLPRIYDYTTIVTTPQWKTHVGAYTRFGDVRPLLRKVDDRYVITRSGDEIELLFDVRQLPGLPEGWIRDYLVYVDGFGKDMDINSAAPDFVGPLPFHGMSAFPYPEDEGYPQDTEHLEFLREWNTRIVDDWYPDLVRHPRLQMKPSQTVKVSEVEDDSPE